ncbi:hypothetical protein EYF80_025920 [Liparis tanakae]|uniref:Uncharacterized protein n=1 Tax=Liparis tanakae TaxID=230148 RepID=A0A4Z2HE24_9TELE|nr:hypothetical protein EYF80_025920 [Liparis tanakae]
MADFSNRCSAGGSGKLLLLLRILLFWVFHSSAYKLPGVLRRACFTATFIPTVIRARLSKEKR